MELVLGQDPFAELKSTVPQHSIVLANPWLLLELTMVSIPPKLQILEVGQE
jgi:hypothetical protein